MKRMDTSHSMNWVDENNRMVGFEDGQDCCEQFGYNWLDEDMEELNEEMEQIVENDPECHFTGEHEDTDNGIKFKCKLRDNIYYLELYNIHNGYYSHGFEFKHNDEVIIDGWI